MKFSTIFAGALAAVASAAPTEKRGSLDISQLNNLQSFNSLDINYLNRINSLDLQLLNTLAVQNNFNALAFQGLFQGQAFDVNALLQLQQLQTILQLGQVGVFNAFDLSSLNLQALQLGLINNVGAFDLGSLIDASLIPQITAISEQTSKYHSLPDNMITRNRPNIYKQLSLARSKCHPNGIITPGMGQEREALGDPSRSSLSVT